MKNGMKNPMAAMATQIPIWSSPIPPPAATATSITPKNVEPAVETSTMVRNPESVIGSPAIRSDFSTLLSIDFGSRLPSMRRAVAKKRCHHASGERLPLPVLREFSVRSAAREPLETLPCGDGGSAGAATRQSE